MRNLGKLSVVSPAFNEENNLDELYAQLKAVVQPLAKDWELLLVDDGSTDGTFDAIRRLRAEDDRVKAIRFSRNFGHEKATTAGLDYAEGDAVAVIDADLQDPPELIAEMVAKWKEGYDVITARRLSREGEGLFKKATSYLYSRMIVHMAGWEIPRDTGDFGLLDRAVVLALRRCRERNRFVRALVAWAGFRRTEVAFHRKPRFRGESKYGVFHLIFLALNSMLSFTIVPLRAAWVLGLLIMAGAGAASLCLLAQGAFEGNGLVAASLWFLGGVQCVLAGILGEYVGKIYLEVQRKPNYVVREHLGIDAHGTRCGAQYEETA